MHAKARLHEKALKEDIRLCRNLSQNYVKSVMSKVKRGGTVLNGQPLPEPGSRARALTAWKRLPIISMYHKRPEIQTCSTAFLHRGHGFYFSKPHSSKQSILRTKILKINGVACSVFLRWPNHCV